MARLTYLFGASFDKQKANQGMEQPRNTQRFINIQRVCNERSKAVNY